MRIRRLLLLCCLTTLAPTARAADLIVDSVGGPGTFANIQLAMTAAAPGDRILVQPGHYPAFHFSRGVHVLGLGAAPSDVTIDRVDFHVNLPVQDYAAALSNVMVNGTGLANAVSISGNELARGTLLLDSVVTTGGVFLRGSTSFPGSLHDGFYVEAVNCSFEAGLGGGFGDAAFYFGGTLELTGVRIAGWDASAEFDTPAGSGLWLTDGSRARLTACDVRGGDGALDESGAQENGADAIKAITLAGFAELALQGGSTIVGGDGAGSGAGGDGVDLVGLIELGDATVTAGAGSPNGADFAASSPTMLGFDPELVATPVRAFGLGSAWLTPGTVVSFSLDPSLSNPLAIAMGFERSAATPPFGSPLVAPLVFFTSTLSFPIPTLALSAVGLLASTQGFYVDPSPMAIAGTNVVTMRVDF